MTPSATFAMPAVSRARILGANDQLRVGVIGVRGRGRSHIQGFRKLAGCRVAALCEVDAAIMDREATRLAKAGEDVDRYVDYRAMLDAKDIDAISIATPNHWHSLMVIHASQAGKDSYCEKPVSHNVFEGRQMVRAARKYERVVACGTQSRSNRGMQAAMQFIHDGELGPVRVARGLCYKPRGSIGKVDGPQKVPESVDYDLWTGPAPLEPLHRRNLHYDWHWVWSTGNGDLGNQGIHQMDLCRWALGESSLPKRVEAFGGRVGYVDDGETPNTMVVRFEYESAPLVFEVRGLPRGADQKGMDKYRGASIGIVIECERGYLVMRSYSAGAAFDRDGHKIREFKGGGDHYANFEQAVRARDPGKLTAEIQEGHLSSALCHLGNVSLRCGEPESMAAIQSAFDGVAPMREAVGRVRQHLRANQVDLERTPMVRGAPLTIDPTTEVVDGPGADALWTREYRAPFVVPDEV